MKTFALACTIGAVLMSGAAYAEGAQQRIDPRLITLTGGDGLDADAYAQGNDHTGGMWEGATGSSSSLAAQRPTYVGSIPVNRQWSRLPANRRRPYGDAY
ncbi:hypothetical protein [Methylobacterium aerolatum]|uniref:Uncharacterized protein n=1 Tax=Methylobacterium aerolatum TaxID=418708 RepID=A0ABU0I2I1_9HYPH|nr:hypothetical protein [Methylobacterium aerolatum]MDQ0448801.1 hypothetical protein [Methylobacterium aerolatum]GJD34070.1 hypothetical protein FMGBMHLM_0966 [Methylobacterium aerolatum]